MIRLLGQMVDDVAQRRPEATAVRCRGETLTYEQLTRRANGIAHLLRQTGAERGDRVAVLLPKGLEVPVSFYGVLTAGAALVPIDPKSPLEQVVRILRATGATHIISEPAKEAVVHRAVAACPEVGQVVGVDLPANSPVQGAPWSVVHESASETPPSVGIDDLDAAYILHTSGSSGTPKLILHTHRSAMSFVDWAVGEFSLEQEDRLSNHSSHHTCFATFDFYAAARVGARTVLVTPADAMMPGSLSTLVEDEAISIWYSVATALVHLSLRGNLEARDLSSLRWVLFAGERFPGKHLRRLVRQIPGARFSQVYGSTEVNVCTYYHLPEGREPVDPLPIGKPCTTADVLVVDDELQPVARGDAGQLLVRGSTVMSGYWGEPVADSSAFVWPKVVDDPDRPYFRTGDRVREGEYGDLVFVARTDFQVKVRGYRVELEGIESALVSLDPVEEAAAVTVENADGEAVLRAAVVVDSRDSTSAIDLRASLSRLLPPQSVPVDISILSSLPRTSTGKIDRVSVRDLLETKESLYEA